MRVSKITDIPKEWRASTLFTSEDVTRQPLARESTDLSVYNVNFGHGVRTKFHIHESDQLLIVTSGKGLIVTENDRVEIKPGDVVFTPAGEMHWHGAQYGYEFDHISITRKGSKIKQIEI